MIGSVLVALINGKETVKCVDLAPKPFSEGTRRPTPEGKREGTA
jgi:hypothetical protein